MNRRFAIGTVNEYGLFEADTLGNDPDLTTHASLEDAITDIQELIARSASWDTEITNGAIMDAETRMIAWRQPTIQTETGQ